MISITGRGGTHTPASGGGNVMSMEREKRL